MAVRLLIVIFPVMVAKVILLLLLTVLVFNAETLEGIRLAF
jgi:hypothetical protein